ncbi:Transposase, Mutator family [Betaproteobacteria bacterium MOLA814]|nr:Transposase, Mutator family [Betaproteobacteria bacterium MOLA814]
MLCLHRDGTEPMAFFDFPVHHWQSIRTSDPVESAFAMLRQRSKRFKGGLSSAGVLQTVTKLGQCAAQIWRILRGYDYLAKVITGATFKGETETTKPDQIAA